MSLQTEARQSSLVTVARMLAIAELRAQKLISRRIGVMLVLTTVSLLVLVIITIRMHGFIAGSDSFGLGNLAVVSVGGLFIAYASVLITGTATQSSSYFTKTWVRSWPISERSSAVILLSIQLAKAAVLTMTLLLALALGAASANLDRPFVAIQSIMAALLLPVPGALAAFIGSAKRHSVGVDRAFLAILGITMIAVITPIHVPAGAFLPLVNILSAPARAVLGLLDGGEVVALSVIWLAVVGVLVNRSLRSIRSSAEAPTTRARRFPALVLRFDRPLLALALGKVSLVIVLLSAATSCALLVWILIPTTTVPAAAGGALFITGTIAVASASFSMIRSAARIDDLEARFIASFPLAPRHFQNLETVVAGSITAAIVILATACAAAARLLPHAQAPLWSFTALLVTAATVMLVEMVKRQRRWMKLVGIVVVGTVDIVLIMVALLVPPMGVALVAGVISLLCLASFALPFTLRTRK